MLKIEKGGVIDSLQMQKTVKPLLILRGILPQKKPLKSQQALGTVYTTQQRPVTHLLGVAFQ